MGSRPLGAWTLDEVWPESYAWSRTRNGAPAGNGTDVVSRRYHRLGYNSGRGWRQLLDEGRLPPTNGQRSRYGQIVEYSPIGVTLWNGSDLWTYSGSVGNIYSGRNQLSVPSDRDCCSDFFSAETLTALDNSVRSKLIDDIRGFETEVLDMLAESGDQLNELAALAHTVVDGIVHWRRDLGKFLSKYWSKKAKDIILKDEPSRLARRLKAARELHNDVTDAWLQYKFGIAPTLRDIDSLVDTLTDGGISKAITRRPKAKMSKSWTACASKQPSTVITGIPVNGVTTATRTLYVGVGAWLTMQPKYLLDPHRKLGLTADGVLPALWEMLPYSWAVDYFSNIGEMIKSFTFQFPEHDYSWSYRMVIDELSWEISGGKSGTPGNKPGSPYTTWTPAHVKWKSFSFDRKANVGLRPRLEVYHIPRLNPARLMNLYSSLHVLQARRLPLHVPGIGTWS